LADLSGRSAIEMNIAPSLSAPTFVSDMAALIHSEQMS